jgi:hypothetical protein
LVTGVTQVQGAIWRRLASSRVSGTVASATFGRSAPRCTLGGGREGPPPRVGHWPAAALSLSLTHTDSLHLLPWPSEIKWGVARWKMDLIYASRESLLLCCCRESNTWDERDSYLLSLSPHVASGVRPEQMRPTLVGLCFALRWEPSQWKISFAALISKSSASQK